jgi:hypothetical protein
MTEAPFEDEVLRSIIRWFPRLGIAACVVILGLAAGLIALALKPKVPAYVIALDNGRIVGYARPFAATDDMAPVVIEQQLKQFIYDARVVTNNREFEQRNIHTVYAIACGQAYKAIDAYYQSSPDNDPVKLGAKGDWRDVNIVRCLREPRPARTVSNGPRSSTRSRATQSPATGKPPSRLSSARRTQATISTRSDST